MTEAQELIGVAKAQGVQLWLDGDVLRFRVRGGAPSPVLLDRLRAKRDAVIEHLRHAPPLAPNFEGFDPQGSIVDIPEYLRSAWTAMKTGAFGGLYVTGPSVVLNFDKMFDATVFSRAIDRLIARHQVLGARAVWGDDQDVLVCDRSSREILEILPPSPALADVDLAEQVARWIAEPFDDRRSLVRVWLAPKASGGSVLAIVVHHFITDDLGLTLAVEDLMEIYEALEARHELPAQRPLQFTHYMAGMDRWIRDGGCERHLAYWSRVLTAAPATHLRMDTCLEGDDFQVLTKDVFRLDNDVVVPLEAFCRKHQATLFMGLLAALGLALSRMTGQRDLVLGMLTDGRQAGVPWSAFGNFSSVVLLRLTASESLDLPLALQLVRDQYVDSLEHWICPYSLVYPQAMAVGQAADAPIVVFRDTRGIGDRLGGARQDEV